MGDHGNAADQDRAPAPAAVGGDTGEPAMDIQPPRVAHLVMYHRWNRITFLH